jgi:protein-tyrosine phosphatase
MNLNVLVQLNAENFAGGGKERKALRMIREGNIQILGTDSHNMTSRPPNMEKAIGSLEQHRMGAELETILQANEVVFRTAMGV